MNNIQFFTTDVAIKQCSNDDLRISPGNIIPHEWYKRFQDKESNPDLVSITILGDLVSWFRNGTSKNYGDHNPYFDCDELCLSYEYFQNKFSFNKDRTRRALVRLEQFKVLSRRVGNTLLSSGSRVNRLYISLNKDFFDSCFVDSNIDIRVLPASNKTNILSLHQCYHHISNKNNDLKNRSMESNFYQNSFEEKEKKEESNIGTKEDKKYYNKPIEEKKTIGSLLKSYLFATPKKLEEFYPLTNEDGDQLRSNSGREFSLKAMNEILLSLTKKLPNHRFPNKSAFMGYMSKVFTYEMRDEVKISNETFRIKVNMNAEDREWSLQEKYLSQIENSLEASPEWHLRKKIASVFERKKAYEILTSLKWLRRVGAGIGQGIEVYKESEMEEGKAGRRKGNEEQEDTLILVLNKEIELSLMDKEILLSQVKATHDGVGDSERRIGRIELQVPKKEISKEQAQNEFISETEQQGTWYQIRKEIKKYIGEDGEAIDKSWFSKLKVEEDKQTKSLTLQATSEFVKDWVEQNYNWLIQKSCAKFNYKHSFA